jgi:hypothetical protein
VAGAQEVSALADGLFVPRMTYEAAVEQVRQLRFESKRNLKSFDDPSKVSLGMAQKSAAQALEGLIERNLATTGDQAALSKFRLAREHIAKSHTVEEAMNPVTGAVHARDLAKSKAPLTGGLKTAADFATAFPRATQKLESFGGTPPFSPLDVSMGTAAGLMGSVASGSPSGLLAAGIPMVRPYAAPVTTRPFVQQGLLRNPVPIQPEVGLLPLFDPTLDRRLR